MQWIWFIHTDWYSRKIGNEIQIANILEIVDYH